jgi:hypothetical protein
MRMFPKKAGLILHQSTQACKQVINFLSKVEKAPLPQANSKG